MGQELCAKRVFGYVLCALTLLSISACGFKVPPAPKTASHDILDAADTKVFLEELRTYSERVKAFRGRFELGIEGRYGEETLTQVLAFQRPRRLRLEFFATNLNTLTALLITNGSSLHAVDPINDIVYRGQASQSIIEQLLSIPFSPEGLMLWSVGRVPVPPVGDGETVRVLRKGKQYIVELKEPKNKSVLLVVQRRGDGYGELEISRYEVRRPDGERLFVSDYRYSEEGQGSEENLIRLPEQIDFWLPKKKLKGVLTPDKSELNPEFGPRDEKLFLGRTPAGAKIYYLEDDITASGVKPFL